MNTPDPRTEMTAIEDLPYLIIVNHDVFESLTRDIQITGPVILPKEPNIY